MNYLRFASSVSHYFIDKLLWNNNIMYNHVHSLVWWVVLMVLVAKTYKLICDKFIKNDKKSDVRRQTGGRRGGKRGEEQEGDLLTIINFFSSVVLLLSWLPFCTVLMIQGKCRLSTTKKTSTRNSKKNVAQKFFLTFIIFYFLCTLPLITPKKTNKTKNQQINQECGSRLGSKS